MIAMCLDIGFDPENADIEVSTTYKPLRFVADDFLFRDVLTEPEPMEVLAREWVAAIKKGEPDKGALEFGAKVVSYL